MLAEWPVALDLAKTISRRKRWKTLIVKAGWAE